MKEHLKDEGDNRRSSTSSTHEGRIVELEGPGKEGQSEISEQN